MDYEFSQPQQMLKDSVATFLKRECPLSRVRELMETETAVDENLWRAVADQGWIGLHLPEKFGGLELSAIELAIVGEAMGQACFPGPFLSTTWAATLLAEGSSESLANQHLPSICEGEKRATVAVLEEDADWDPSHCQISISKVANGYIIDGCKHLVMDAQTADWIVCVGNCDGESIILLVDSSDESVSVTPTPGIDATRKLSRVVFQNCSVSSEQVVAQGDEAQRAWLQSNLVGAVFVCAELSGAMQWLLKETIEYVSQRKQFDKVVGSFQAVQQKCATMLLESESGKSASYYAAWALSQQLDDASRSVSIAKSFCGDAAREVGNMAIQCHGGIGFTWEHDIQLFYKRAKANDLVFGDATYHREQIAKYSIDLGQAIRV